MKFTDGNWLIREGFDLTGPLEIRDFEIKEDALTIYAPSRHIRHRGDTLEGPLFTITLSSPLDDVIKVKFEHFKGAYDKGPAFDVNEDNNVQVSVKNEEDKLVFKSADLRAVLNKENFSLEFFNQEGKITASSHKNMAYIKSEDNKTYIREQLNLDVGENVYGLGERFGHFVKNGQVVDIWNEDGGTSSEQAYKNIPFYMTNRGYGVFVNHPERVSFEVASERVSKVQFSVPGESLEYYIINGPDLKDILRRYTDLTGKPALPPAWSFGLWLTTSFTTNYDEETVSGFVDGMADRDIPLEVFHFDCFWMKEFHWTNLKWDEEVFPDPEGMLKRLKEKGLKISVWINPYIAQRSYLFEEGKEMGYLLKTPEGDVWQWDRWQAGMAIVDFTNPDACKWFQDKLEELLDMGVDCFKTDFGERIPTDVEYFDGSDPVKMHNYYSYLYNKIVFELLERKRGKGEAVLFARSGSVGSQQFPVHWGGDCASDYSGMAESLRGGLSLSMSGFSFWSHDIGGFESTGPVDLYKRWVAFGLLSSHSRLHGSKSYRVPWLYDEESVDIVRYYTRLKCSLMPYIFSNAVKASETGIPIMRSMIVEFQDDPGCDYLDRQYMLGDSLLVAPIFNEKGNVSYYLPEGLWTNFITGEVVEGGHWIKEQHGYMSLPLMVRPNSIIPVGVEDSKPVYNYTDNVELHVFELVEGDIARTEIYNTEAEKVFEVEMLKENDVINVDVNDENNNAYTIILRNINKVSDIENGDFEETDEGIRIIPDSGVKGIKISL
ncbi:MAG: alpha-xylosidase [Bacillota bacterium]